MFGGLNVHTVAVECPTVKTGDVTKYVTIPTRARIVGAYLVASATLAAHADNTCTVTVTNLEDGADGTGVVATKVNSVAGGAFTAGTPVAMTIGATETLKRVEAGEVLKITTVEAGTLGADPNITVSIAYQNV